MLRSLVKMSSSPDGEVTLKRNLSMEDLQEAVSANHLCWIDIVDPTQEDIEWVEVLLGLNPAVVQDLKRVDRRPTLLIYPDYWFLSLFQARVHLDQVQSEEVHCLGRDHVFITIRHAKSTAVDDAYELAARSLNYWESNATYLLYLTTQQIADSYFPLLDRINSRLIESEEDLLANGNSVSVKPIYRIKQQLVSLRQMVTPQREMLSNIIGDQRLMEDEKTRGLFRHLYERFLRVYDDIDSQRDLWSNVLELMQSQEASDLAHAVNRLTILSMLFLPLTFLISLFELNFITTTPELSLPVSGLVVFIVILGLAVLAGGGMLWFFQNRGWL